MTGSQRRSAIYQQLTHADAPISAAALAQQFSVTRQVVVGDIALLRAEGHSITATSRGYIIPAETGLIRTIACVHSAQDTRQELFAMVACGSADAGFACPAPQRPDRRRASAHPFLPQRGRLFLPEGFPSDNGNAVRSGLTATTAIDKS